MNVLGASAFVSFVTSVSFVRAERVSFVRAERVSFVRAERVSSVHEEAA